MQYSLMKRIFNYIIDNRDDFGLINAAVSEFRAYIYDDQGEHLIGGEQVHTFIVDSVTLMNKGAQRDDDINRT